jgi:hypothetical protein
VDIGSLFLNLGIKGASKTVGELSNVKKGIGDVASMSLEAKAALVGAAYALERLFSNSNKAGTDLTNFNALTGESVKTLQQYQYAGRQVGISNQTMEGSFKTLQSAMTKTMLGQGGPAGLARVSMLTGGISQKDIEEFAKRPELLIQKLQQYASKEKNIGLRNETLKSFGIDESMIAGLSRNAFRPDVLKKAPTYSNQEVGQLDKANIAWSNLGNKIEMAVGHFNAMHGGQLVGDISKIVDQVLKLANAFTLLAEKLHLFEGIGKIFEGWTQIFKGVNAGVESVTGAFSEPKKRNDLIHNTVEGGKNVIMGILGDIGDKFGGSHPIAPQVSKNSSTGNTQNNDVNIVNNFQHPGTDHKKTADSQKHAVQQAYRQLYAQNQGN